jgi:hypothetical protein
VPDSQLEVAEEQTSPSLKGITHNPRVLPEEVQYESAPQYVLVLFPVMPQTSVALAHLVVGQTD